MGAASQHPRDLWVDSVSCDVFPLGPAAVGGWPQQELKQRTSQTITSKTDLRWAMLVLLSVLACFLVCMSFFSDTKSTVYLLDQSCF